MFTCNLTDEIVILCDGRVTTCCYDALGENAYADLATDSFEEVVGKYRQAREKLASDPQRFPRCAECLRIFSESGHPAMNFQATAGEAEQFVAAAAACSVHHFVVEPTVQCNLRCVGCPQNLQDLPRRRNTHFLDLNRLQAWLEGHLTAVWAIRFYNYGETFLHPGALDFLLFLREKGASGKVSIATNGMPLNSREKRLKLVQSGVQAIHFSIHGSDQAQLEKYMTKRFSARKVMAILSDLVAIKKRLAVKKPLLIWKYLLFEWNDEDQHILTAKRKARALGIDGILFEMAAHPAPSKRFTPDGRNWALFTRGMALLNGGVSAQWDDRCPDWDAVRVPFGRRLRNSLPPKVRSLLCGLPGRRK